MLNKVMLIGNLGADPDIRYMPSGDTVTNVSLATTRRWKDRQTGEPRETTEWHRVVFFNIGNFKIAEIAAEYLKKGSKVYIEGRIQTRKWQDNTGQNRYSTEIIAEQMQMLNSRTEGTANFGQQQTAPRQTNQNTQQPLQQQQSSLQQNFQNTSSTAPLNQPDQNPFSSPTNQQPASPQQPATYQPSSPSQDKNAVTDDFDDDIPF